MERKELSRQWKKETGNAGSANIRLYAIKKTLPPNSCKYYIDVLINKSYSLNYGPFVKSEARKLFLYNLFEKIEEEEEADLISFKSTFYYLENDTKYIIMENHYTENNNE